MGAIFFYIFIYFIGYYGSNIFNMFTVKPLVTNRFAAALIPVFCVAMLHGYMIVTKPPPASQDVTVESALFTYVAMPVIIVTLGAFYFSWNARRTEEEEAEEAARRAEEDDEDIESTVTPKKSSVADAEGGAFTATSEISNAESAENKTDDSETDKKSKDA